MKRYERSLTLNKNLDLHYLDYESCKRGTVATLRRVLQGKSVSELIVLDPTDFILAKRLKRVASELNTDLTFLNNPGFINTPDQNAHYSEGKQRWFMAEFYKSQRKRLNVLMNGDQPVGGKWSFDADNRKKVPKNLLNDIPQIQYKQPDDIECEARDYVNRVFPSNPGSIENVFYPTDHASAKHWLNNFLEIRFGNFGIYEDAIVKGESWLWHSVLTPALNIGLLTPEQILNSTIRFTERNEVPMNSCEGFVRQIIGWREFIRATYEDLGVVMRTTNHWQHHRKIPDSFWNATTGIEPIDDVISRVLKTGYCHHIERLMVLGGFMFLCEFDPDEIYRWFMEMFVDSYDWVMVPNAYAMSQNADGGLITTKPYFSGSSYIRKMSNYKTGPWCEVWDALYWRWIWNHADELSKNPRWSMMCSMARKMDEPKMSHHLNVANDYLRSLDIANT